jgi:hypothetical protein
LPQRELGAVFEIATDKAVLMHSHFKRSRASVIDGGGAKLLASARMPRMRRTLGSPSCL